MENRFIPTPGAAGFQLSNPSILDITSLSASLEIFALAGGMPALRQKSKLLTAYLEAELRASAAFHAGAFEIITSSVSEERGAQLSLRVPEEDLGTVMKGLEGRGCVVDERKPDVIRFVCILFNPTQYHSLATLFLYHRTHSTGLVTRFLTPSVP